ncbi:MAG: NAD(P)H-dependent oxidoreductase [Marinisporobacter sp.]|jgi:flavodoxin|nr:NAD(P)H-dependent oxidoreductase [Marinisporobacter sp.]
MKALVVYYSLEGNTKFLAEAVAEAVGADILELKPEKDIPKKGFMRYIKGGSQVVRKKRPDLMSFDEDLSAYDFIYFGTPVWAASFAPSYNTFFDKVEVKGKKIALFCCYRGSAGSTFEHFKERLKGNEIVDTLEFKEPVKVEENKEKVMAWAKKLNR